MTTEVISITGLAGWAQVYTPDTFMNATKWKLNIYPENDAEWEKVKKAGIQKKRKTNSDPEKGPLGDYIQLTRDQMKVIKGKIVYFTGPVVVDNEGLVIVDYINNETEKRIYSYDEETKDKVVRRGKPVLIGNGSRVKVDVAVYDTVKGKGQRLETIKVLDLIEYEKGEYELPPVKEDIRSAVEFTSEPVAKNKDDNPPW